MSCMSFVAPSLRWVAVSRLRAFSVLFGNLGWASARQSMVFDYELSIVDCQLPLLRPQRPHRVNRRRAPSRHHTSYYGSHQQQQRRGQQRERTARTSIHPRPHHSVPPHPQAQPTPRPAPNPLPPPRHHPPSTTPPPPP